MRERALQRSGYILIFYEIRKSLNKYLLTKKTIGTTTNFNVKVSAGEGKAVIGVLDTYAENWPLYSLITNDGNC